MTSDWIIAYDGTHGHAFGFGCLRCGEEQEIATPVSFSVFLAAAEAFKKDHLDCELAP